MPSVYATVGYDDLESLDMQTAPSANLVLQELLSANQRGHLSAAEQAVLELGRAYQPGPRPKGFRLRAAKQCFYNAGDYATRDPPLGKYVEGFACSLSQPPFRHAWLTLDGSTAIDVTLRDSENFQYFGVEAPVALVSKWMGRRGYFGLFDPCVDELLEDLRKSQT